MAVEPIRVLVVDDNDEVRSVLTEIIEGEPDLSLVAAASGVEEGIALARAWYPDIVVLDVSMPDGGGMSVARSLSAEPDPPGIVAYSAFDQSLITRVMLNAGASEYVSKSAPVDDLLEAIRRTARLAATR